jgi:hypothetical protein
MKTRDEYERLIAGCTADIEDADDLARRLRAERCEYFREMRAMTADETEAEGAPC